MRLFKHTLLSFILILSFSINVAAQRNFTEEADNAFQLKQYYDAIELYQKAYSRVRGNRAERARILFQIAECYRLTNNVRRSVPQYRRVVRSGYPDPIAHLHLAEALKMSAEYDEAIVEFQNFLEKVPDDPRGKRGIESCKLAQMWLDNPTRYEVENARQLNTRENDFAATFADNRRYNSLIITSSRDGSIGRGTDAWTGENFTSLFLTELGSGRRGRRARGGGDEQLTWSTPQLLDEGPINTPSNEGTASLNERGNTMYFTRCMVIRRQTTTCHIYTSNKRGRAWSEPELVVLGPDSFNYGHPSISADELTLYFASDMPGGYGGRDIWVATRDRRTRPFETPQNLGPTINTEGDELYPFLRGDNVLYFSSNGHIGMGGLDIFRSEKVGGTWSTPENMKHPINSPADDFAIIFKGDEEEGFFSSNRDGGRGGDDIYSFVLPPLLFTIQGIVRDDSTKQVLEGAGVRLVGSDGTSVELKTNEAGFYRYDDTQILANTTYELFVDKEGYFAANAKESTVGLEHSRDFVIDFNLEPIPVEPIELPEILYALDRWELQPQFQDSLNDLIETLNNNPTLVIELGSHTDARGSHVYNDTLSQRRAQSVVDYLIEKGIAPDRLEARGYGKRVPKTLERDIRREGHLFKKGSVLTEEFINGLPNVRVREAAHQMNRRTEFRILHDNYVPHDENIPIERGRIEIIDDLDAIEEDEQFQE